jgi:hypothetical protein
MTRQEINSVVIALFESAVAMGTSTKRNPGSREYRQKLLEFQKLWEHAHYGALRTHNNKRNSRGNRIATVEEKCALLAQISNELNKMAWNAPTKIDEHRTDKLIRFIDKIRILDNGELDLYDYNN